MVGHRQYVRPAPGGLCLGRMGFQHVHLVLVGHKIVETVKQRHAADQIHGLPGAAADFQGDAHDKVERDARLDRFGTVGHHRMQRYEHPILVDTVISTANQPAVGSYVGRITRGIGVDEISKLLAIPKIVVAPNDNLARPRAIADGGTLSNLAVGDIDRDMRENVVEGNILCLRKTPVLTFYARM